MSEQTFTDKNFDVAIIGGGIIGLSLARALKKRGVEKILVIEKNDNLGMEASSAAAGMLAPQSEANNADNFFNLACASRDTYMHFALELFDETGIDIELEKTGTLYLAFTKNDLKEIEERYEWQSKAGLQVEKLGAEEVLKLEPAISDNVLAALRFPQDFQVDNWLVVNALTKSCEKLGVEFLTNTNVETLLVEDNCTIGVETFKGNIKAKKIVVACGAWVSFLKFTDNSINAPAIQPVRGQMLCFDAHERIIRHVIYSPRGYIVPRLSGEIIAGSTTEHAGFEKRVTCEGLNKITANALEISHALAKLPMKDSWAGLRPFAENKMPIIGASEKVKGLYYAAGHYRNGILLAPITAELLSNEIVNETQSPLLKDFAPKIF